MKELRYAEDKSEGPKGIAGLLADGTLAEEENIDYSAAEKSWREDETLFEMACSLLCDDEELAQAGELATRSYQWQVNFQQVWMILKEQHGWSVRSSTTRERIEPGARVQVRTSAAATLLLDESLTSKERKETLAHIGRSGMPLEARVRTRYKDGTYDVVFPTGGFSRVYRQDLLEMEEKDSEDSSMVGEEDGKRGLLKLYDVVAVKRDGWDRWHGACLVVVVVVCVVCVVFVLLLFILFLFSSLVSSTSADRHSDPCAPFIHSLFIHSSHIFPDAEITKVRAPSKSNGDQYTYDAKLTVMSTMEEHLARSDIRKGRAPGTSGSPFYYFKPGALRQSGACTLGEHFFDAETRMIGHIVHESSFSGRVAALEACRLKRKVAELEEELEAAKIDTKITQQSRARSLGGDLLTLSFQCELKRQEELERAKEKETAKNTKSVFGISMKRGRRGKKTRKQLEHEKKVEALELTKCEFMRMISLNTRARSLLTEGVHLLHSDLGPLLLHPKECARIFDEIDTNKDGKIRVDEIVQFCLLLKEKDSRSEASKWVLENILLDHDAKWMRSTSNKDVLLVTTKEWVEIMRGGDFENQERMDFLSNEIARYTVMKGAAIASGGKEDEEEYTNSVRVLENELHSLKRAKRRAKQGERVFETLESKELLPGMMSLRDVHRYQDQLDSLEEKYSSSKGGDNVAARRVVGADVLLQIVEGMRNEDNLHDEALVALNVLFDRIDVDRAALDGRVAVPVLLKRLADDPQSRSLLALASKRASLGGKSRAQKRKETKREVAVRVDALVSLLVSKVSESEKKEDAEQKKEKRRRTADATIQSSSAPPRSGYIGVDEFYQEIRDMGMIRKARVVETIQRAAARVAAVLNSSSSSSNDDDDEDEDEGCEKTVLERWKTVARSDAQLRQIMRAGGLSVTLEEVLLRDDKDSVEVLERTKRLECLDVVSSFQESIVLEAMLLGDPLRSTTPSEKTLEMMWSMIQAREGAATRSKSPMHPTPRAILISKEMWAVHMIRPVTRMEVTSSEEEDITKLLTSDMMSTLPLGLRLAREAPDAHLAALDTLVTEHEGYLLQSEILSFGERQSHGESLRLLKAEITNVVSSTRTTRMNFIRQMFDAVLRSTKRKGGQRKKKMKKQEQEQEQEQEVYIFKSDLLKSIAYEDNVRSLLGRSDCPPGLAMAIQDPRKFRRLLQRALATTVTTATAATATTTTMATKRSKNTAMMLSQLDVYALALEIEREEKDAPRRLALRNAGDVLRQVLDLVADNGSTMGVRKGDLILALRNKRVIQSLLSGNIETGVALPRSVSELLDMEEHVLEDFNTTRKGWVTAKELLLFCGVVTVAKV